MLPRVKKLAILGIACSLGSLPTVSKATPAYTVSTTVPFTTSPAQSNGLQTGWNFTGTIPQFTASLAGVNADCSTGDTCVLTGVSLIITDVATGSVTFTAPNNPSGQLSDELIGSTISYTDPFSGAVKRAHASYDICDGSNVSLVSSPTPVCDQSSDSLSFATNQQIQAVLLKSASNSVTTTSTAAAILNALSSGPLGINSGTTQSYVNGTDSNNVSSTPDVTAFVSGQVTFTYTDTASSGPSGPSVPEPASLTVFGIGLLGIGSARAWMNRR